MHAILLKLCTTYCTLGNICTSIKKDTSTTSNPFQILVITMCPLKTRSLGTTNGMQEFGPGGGGGGGVEA